MATEPRAVITHEGPGTPIVLTIYGPDGEVAVPPQVRSWTRTLASSALAVCHHDSIFHVDWPRLALGPFLSVSPGRYTLRQRGSAQRLAGVPVFEG